MADLDPDKVTAYIARQPEWYADMMALNRFLGEVAAEAASTRTRVKLVVIQEGAGSGTRTVVRRNAHALGVEPIEIRPGLRHYPETDDATGWRDVLSPHAVAMTIVEVGDPDGADREADPLAAVEAIHRHSRDGYVNVVVAVVYGMVQTDAVARIAERCGVDAADVSAMTRSIR